MKAHRRVVWAVAFLGCATFHACQEKQPADLAALAPGIDRASTRGPDQFLQKAVVGPQGDGTYVVATTQIVSPAGESVV